MTAPAPQDLVALPVKSIAGVLALVARLDAEARGWLSANAPKHGHAKAATLPAALERPRQRMLAAVTALRDADSSRPPVDRDDARKQAEADANLDEAWRALEGWLGGWTHCRDGHTPDAGSVRALYDQLFPAAEGMRFIGYAYYQEHRASAQRLPLLADKTEGRRLVTDLGGERLVTWLFACQQRYTRALHLDGPKAAASVGVDLRPLLKAALETTRAYVAKVAASPDPEDDGSDALAQHLLAPLGEFDETHGAPPDPPAPPAPPTPTPSP